MNRSPVAYRLRLRQAEELQYYLLKQIEVDQSAELLEELHIINEEVDSVRLVVPGSPSSLTKAPSGRLPHWQRGTAQ